MLSQTASLSVYGELLRASASLLRHRFGHFQLESGQYLPPTGIYLGDLTSELEPDKWITSCASLGAKCYCYVPNREGTCTKVKGHTINEETKKKLNLDNMVKILCDRFVERIICSHLLKRNENQLSVFKTDMTKTWRVTYDGR